MRTSIRTTRASVAEQQRPAILCEHAPDDALHQSMQVRRRRRPSNSTTAPWASAGTMRPARAATMFATMESQPEGRRSSAAHCTFVPCASITSFSRDAMCAKVLAPARVATAWTNASANTSCVCVAGPRRPPRPRPPSPHNPSPHSAKPRCSPASHSRSPSAPPSHAP